MANNTTDIDYFGNYTIKNTTTKSSGSTASVMSFDLWTSITNMLLVAFGIPSICANVWVIVAIFLGKNLLKSAFNKVLIGLSITNALTSFGSVTTGTMRILGTYAAYQYTRQQCNAGSCLLTGGVQVVQVFMLFIAFDRVLAVGVPVWYMAQDKKKMVYGTFLTAVVYAIIVIPTQFIGGSEMNDIAKSCVPAATWQLAWQTYSAAFLMATFILGVVDYSILFYLIYQKKKAAPTSQSKNEAKATMMVVFIILNYSICWAVPNFVANAGLYLGLPVEIRSKLSPLIGVFYNVFSFFNVLIYMTNGDLRKAMLCQGKGKVKASPAGSTSTVVSKF